MQLTSSQYLFEQLHSNKKTVLCKYTATCFDFYRPSSPVPVAERSKARVYGRSLAGIAGSNPAGGMDGCPL